MWFPNMEPGGELEAAHPAELPLAVSRHSWLHSWASAQEGLLYQERGAAHPLPKTSVSASSQMNGCWLHSESLARREALLLPPSGAAGRKKAADVTRQFQINKCRTFRAASHQLKSWWREKKNCSLGRRFSRWSQIQEAACRVKVIVAKLCLHWVQIRPAEVENGFEPTQKSRLPPDLQELCLFVLLFETGCKLISE